MGREKGGKRQIGKRWEGKRDEHPQLKFLATPLAKANGFRRQGRGHNAFFLEIEDNDREARPRPCWTNHWLL